MSAPWEPCSWRRAVAPGKKSGACRNSVCTAPPSSFDDVCVDDFADVHDMGVFIGSRIFAAHILGIEILALMPGSPLALVWIRPLVTLRPVSKAVRLSPVVLVEIRICLMESGLDLVFSQHSSLKTGTALPHSPATFSAGRRRSSVPGLRRDTSHGRSGYCLPGQRYTRCPDCLFGCP